MLINKTNSFFEKLELNRKLVMKEQLGPRNPEFCPKDFLEETEYGSGT